MLAQKVGYLLDHPEEVERIGVRNNSAATRVYGPDSYRGSLHLMVSQWVCHHPHWFPLIQQPGGPVWTREGEGLRQVTAIPEGYTNTIREFPESVVCQLPVLGLPPIEYAAIQGLPQPVSPLPDSPPELPRGKRSIRARWPKGRSVPDCGIAGIREAAARVASRKFTGPRCRRDFIRKPSPDRNSSGNSSTGHGDTTRTSRSESRSRLDSIQNNGPGEPTPDR